MESPMTRFFVIVGLVAALAAGSAPPALARGWSPPVIAPQFDDRSGENRAAVRPLHELLPAVRRELGGDFVGMVRLEEGGSRPAYVIRWRFDDGRIGDVRVDAQSGAVLGR